ncbi:hypothetical protein T484DRAFT_1885824, partial [Baffinella frigidus]
MAMRGMARGLLGGSLLLLFAASALALTPAEISAMRQSRRLGRTAAQPADSMARRAPTPPQARRSEGQDRPESRPSEEEEDQALQAAVNRAKLDREFRRSAAREMGGADVFQRVPGMKVRAHRVRPSEQEESDAAEKQAEQQAKQEAEEKAEAAFLKRESPMSVHDCGIYGNECNVRGVGPDAGTKGNFMKGRTQALSLTAAGFPAPKMPDCSKVDCGAQLHFQRSGVSHSASPRFVRRTQQTSRRAPSAPWLASTRGKSPAPVLSMQGVGRLLPVAAAASPVSRVDGGARAGLSKTDIKALASELLKEAAMPDRHAAQAHEHARQLAIRAAVSTSPHHPAVTTPMGG